jgi:hypothetical protein
MTSSSRSITSEKDPGSSERGSTLADDNAKPRNQFGRTWEEQAKYISKTSGLTESALQRMLKLEKERFELYVNSFPISEHRQRELAEIVSPMPPGEREQFLEDIKKSWT